MLENKLVVIGVGIVLTGLIYVAISGLAGGANDPRARRSSRRPRSIVALDRHGRAS